MIDVKLLGTGWANLIGCRQTTNPSAPEVADFLTGSLSGLYVNDRAPALLTSENIIAALPDDFAYIGQGGEDEPEYGDGMEGQLNYALDRALTAARSWIGSQLLTDARLSGRARTVQGDASLYEGLGSAYAGIVKEGRFCGIELRPHINPDIAIEITRIGLQTLGDDATGLLIYLYHESRAEPLARWQLTAPGSGWGRGFAWASPPPGTFVLRSGGDESTYPAGGAFYLGYYEDDLPGQVANRALPVLRVDCGTCDTINAARAATWATLFTARACRLPNSATADRDNLPLWQVTFPADTNNGLNLGVVARCDLTPLLIRNRYLLAPLYQLSAAIELLLMMHSAVSTNPSSVLTQQRAGLLLYGDPYTKKGGLLDERTNILKGLALDLTGSRPPCVSPAGGVTYSSGAV